MPSCIRPIVVDNGSTDRTSDVARELGALVVQESRAGYGAAVQAGVRAATSQYVAVMDADGSMTGADLLPLLDDVTTGRADMSVGARRPSARGVWPWHARLGNRAVLALLKRRTEISVTDIAAMRVCSRQALLDLEVQDRRFGYPLELLMRANDAGWVLTEHPVAYGPRAAGTKSKVSGSVRGSLRAASDFAGVLR